MTLPTRRIGKDNVSAIGFGAMGLSAFYGAPESDEDRFKVLDSALDRGCTFWDTADVYGDSEELLGKWFKRTGKRNQIFLATKFGFAVGSERFLNGDPEYVKLAAEISLSKLGVDTIDLYYLHRADPTVPIEHTVRAMSELVKAGKVKYIGLLKFLQQPSDDEKIGLLKTCRELGVKVVAYSPLGRGLLTGQYTSLDSFEEDDFRRQVPRYSNDNFPNILKIADGLKAIGERHGATAGQVAIAWLLAQGDDIIPIPGTKKIKYLIENIGATSVRLSSQDLIEVRRISENADAVQSDRYPVGMGALMFGDTPELK